jgi:hypothetical protein
MKFSVKNTIISAFFTLAVGLFMPASAQNPNSSYANGAAASLAGTAWTVVETDSSGDRNIFNFMLVLCPINNLHK